MQTNELQDVAATLRAARAKGEPVTAPTKTWPALDADAAFEVQRITVGEAIANGDRVVGYKLGNIAKVMQDAFGLDQPDYGYLLASTFAYEGTTLAGQISSNRSSNSSRPSCWAAASGSQHHRHRRHQRHRLRHPRNRNHRLPCQELGDRPSRHSGRQRIHRGVILGGTPRRLTDLTLRDTRGALHFNGREVISGNTKNILGNPLAAVAWLCNRLADYDVEFAAGQVILPGSCLQAVPMNQAGYWSGTFEGWGTIEFDVSNE